MMEHVLAIIGGLTVITIGSCMIIGLCASVYGFLKSMKNRE